MMEDAGQKLKSVRERLGLTVREVEEYSNRIAEVHQSEEYTIALSRLSDIENKRTVPSLYRLYSLCAIYRIDFSEALGWYGVSLANQPADSAMLPLAKLPLMMLNRFDLRDIAYGYIGTNDWSMHPILPPGSLVVIDQTRRKILNSGWTSEFDRPIYFMEHRDGYSCCWCTLRDTQLVLHPHPSSLQDPEVYIYPKEIDVIGQVTFVAFPLEPGTKRRSND
jgi:transcriptional regulator with XRE-family HTH domain